MEYFKVSTETFPFLFGANVLVMILLTKINMRLVQNINPATMLKVGVTMQLLAGLALIVFSFEASLYVIFSCMVIYVGSLGFIFGNGMALALEYFKKDTGVANAVIGVSEYTIGGIIGFLASLIHTGDLTPVFLMMAGTSSLALLSLKLGR